MVLFCLGSVAAGKTSLLQSLTAEKSAEEIEEDKFNILSKNPLPTVGVNHFTVDLAIVSNHPPPQKIKKTKKKEKKKKNGSKADNSNSIPVKELGGELAQNWPAYLSSSADRIIYVIDSTNLSCLPEVCVHFVNCLETLSNSQSVKDPRILIVYSKTDFIATEEELKICLNRIRLILRLPYLIDWYRKIHFSETVFSAKTLHGTAEVKNWINLNRPAEL